MRRPRLYYHLKPYLPWRLRMGLRGVVARRKRQALRNVWPINEAAGAPPPGWPGWPGGKKFAFVLTHDVEGQRGLAKSTELMRLEQELGYRSSFNFIPEGEYRVPPELRQTLTRNGYEVGVHDLRHDGKLYWSYKAFKENARGINRYMREWGAGGFRAGFMLHDLDWLHELNIEYDASTFDTDPFEPQPDGATTIFPFWVEQKGRPGYVELPYTLPQDSTMFLLFREEGIDIWKKKFDWLAAHGGMAMVITHPDYMQFEGDPREPRTFCASKYTELLKYARDKYGDTFWQPLPRELAAWYREEGRHGRPTTAQANGSASARPPCSKNLKGKNAAIVLYSSYPADPRPRRELEALVEQGMNVDIVCLQEDENEPLREQIGAVSVTRVPMRHQRGNKLTYVAQYSGFILRALAFLTRRSLSRRYALIHVHNMPDVLVFSALFPKITGSRLILDLHDPMPELYCSIYSKNERHLMIRSLKTFEKWSIGFADLALTPNEAFRRVFCSRSCSPDKMRIIMNTPDEEIFRPAPQAASRNGESHAGFTLMYHGLIVERHGLDTAIEAVALLAGKIPGVAVKIYGKRNAYMDGLEEQVKKRGLEKHALFCGWRRLEDIPAEITGCDLGVIPNKSTPFTEINFPTRIFEYLSLGKPVIVPDTEGIRDYFKKDEIFFFKANDPEDLARTILWAYEHPEETRAIAARARRIYLDHLWHEEKSRFVGLVDNLLA